MRIMKKVVAVALSVGIIGSLAGCGLISKTPEGIAATVVAKINNETITRAEFDKKFNSYLDQLKLYYGEDQIKAAMENAEQAKGIKEEYLNGIVEEALLIQKAKELKVYADEKTLTDEVEKNYQESVTAQEGEDKLIENLKKTNTTVEEYKELIKNSLLITKLQEETVKTAAVTDDEAKKYYDDNQYLFTEKPSKMNISHILVATEDEAKKVKERLDKGEDFAAVAKEVSADPGSKEEGGNLGDIEYADNDLDKTFFINAVAVPAGKISVPFKTQFGWHIVKANSKEEYPVKSFDSVKEEIKEKLLPDAKQEMYDKKLEEWKDKSKIKTYPDRL